MGNIFLSSGLFINVSTYLWMYLFIMDYLIYLIYSCIHCIYIYIMYMWYSISIAHGSIAYVAPQVSQDFVRKSWHFGANSRPVW